jgi:hypothetical protein
MVRNKNPQQPPEPVSMYAHLRHQLGVRVRESVADWDCDAAAVLQAMLQVVAAGNCLFIRPGTGGGSWGIAIWEGDIRNPAEWLYSAEQTDEWADAVLRLHGVDRRGQTQPIAAD